MPTLYNTVRSNSILTAIGGVAPAGGDTVILQEESDRYTAGLASITNALALFHAQPPWSGDIRDGDLVLSGGATTVKIESAHRDFRLAAGGGTFTTLENNPFSGGVLRLTNAVVTTLVTSAGTATLSDSVNCTTLHMDGGSVDTTESANAFTTVNAWAGVLNLMRDVTTLNVGGTARVTATSDTVSPTTTNLYGGVYELGVVGSSAGTFNGYAGVLDARNLGRGWTAGGGVLHPSLTIIRPRTGVTFDVSACTVIGRGPTYV